MPSEPVSIEDVDDVTLVRLVGELDVASVAQLRDGLQQVGSDRNVVVVLTMASFIDSTILGVLLGALRRAKEERRGFVFALEPDAASGAIDRLLEMSGLLRIFPVYASVEEASAAAASGRNVPPV
jgi:anti-sigma B factor antagonist